MYKIDIERLMDIVDEKRKTYFDYCYELKTLYKGDRDKLDERQKSLEYANHYHDRANDALLAVIEVFRLDKDQITRLYIAGRAVREWRERTKWTRLIPGTMQKQIERFIFGAPSAPSYVCECCGCWEVYK